MAVLRPASSKTLSCGLSMGIFCHTGGNLGRENWVGQVNRWKQVLSMYTENERGSARFLFLKTLLHPDIQLSHKYLDGTETVGEGVEYVFRSLRYKDVFK